MNVCPKISFFVELSLQCAGNLTTHCFVEILVYALSMLSIL